MLGECQPKKEKQAFLRVRISYDNGTWAVEKVKRKKGTRRKSRGRRMPKGMMYVATQHGVQVDVGQIPDFTTLHVDYLDQETGLMRRESVRATTKQQVVVDLPSTAEVLELREMPVSDRGNGDDTLPRTGALIASLSLDGSE